MPFLSMLIIQHSILLDLQFNFSFLSLTHYIVDKIIASLKNKSWNIYLVLWKILKYLSSLISPILSCIVNKSLSFCRFPNCLKMARVIPLHEAGDSRNVNNYRPISLLSIFSKILKKVVSYQLSNNFENLKLFDSSQFGLR